MTYRVSVHPNTLSRSVCRAKEITIERMYTLEPPTIIQQTVKISLNAATFTHLREGTSGCNLKTAECDTTGICK